MDELLIEFGFTVKGYPGSGRRVEQEADLSLVSRLDIVHSAFMGDALLVVDEVDIVGGGRTVTHFGRLSSDPRVVGGLVQSLSVVGTRPSSRPRMR